MFYRIVKSLGLKKGTLFITLLSFFLSLFIFFTISLSLNQSLDLIGIIFSALTPLVIAPIPSYTLLSLVKRAYESEEKLLKSNKELQLALQEVKELSGMLPICACCKKVRDDNGYWNQVEEYFSKKTDLLFSHSLCPICYKEEMKRVDEFFSKEEEFQLKVEAE